jgi:Co/Zn/Cd efflux system component
LFIEAIHRIVDPEEIDEKIMLITACIGLVFNIISIFTLHSCGGEHCHHHHHHDHEASSEKKGEEGQRLSHCLQPEFVKMN